MPEPPQDQNPEASENRQHDPSKLVRAAAFGRFNFEGLEQKETNSILGVFQDDIRRLWSALTPEAQQKAPNCYQLPDAVPAPSRPRFRWPSMAPSAGLRRARSWATEDEAKVATGVAPPPDQLLPRPLCARMCQGPKGLDNRVSSAHKKYEPHGSYI